MGRYSEYFSHFGKSKKVAYTKWASICAVDAPINWLASNDQGPASIIGFITDTGGFSSYPFLLFDISSCLTYG